MIDTHCHLYWDSFHADLPAVLQRARDAGVDRAITIAIDKETAQACLKLVSDYPAQLKCAIGVHPSETDIITEDDLLWLEAVAGDPAVVAIGEIGLDIYRGETNLKAQEKLFERMLHLARYTDLPVVIHHRAAGLRMIEVIASAGNTRGVFHCFSEDYVFAKRVLDQGFHISFTGNITYKNSKLPDLAKQLPLDRILLETDAPFMAPMPIRGQRCEPLHVVEVAQKLAELHNTTLDQIATVTTRSAETLFNL